MATAERSFAAAVQAAAQESRPRAGAHPTPDTLVSYHERRLPAGEAEEVREHLALCAECTETILDLDAFPDIKPRGAHLHEVPLEDPQDVEDRAWRRLQEEGALMRRSIRRPFPLTLAASILFCAVGAAFFFSGRTAPLDANYRLWELAGTTSAPERSDGQSVEAPAAGQGLHVALDVWNPMGFERFRVELADDAGRILWEKGNLELIEGKARFEVPPGLELPSDGSFRLLGQDGEEGEAGREIDSFFFKLAGDGGA